MRHHPNWKGVVAYDEFNARAVIRSRPPWGEEKPDTHWNDQHETRTRIWFQRADIDAGLGDVGRAIQAAARHNTVHPVREYLDGLVWDRKPRLDTWLVTYFQYIRAVGSRFFISAVGRIYEPGCQVDHVLVLEGPQGQRKSQSLRALAVKDEWFSDRLSHMASKDAAIEVAGVWVFELAEMDALTRAASSTAKAFLTRRRDRFRPPHGRHTISLPRQCVFAGTINPPVGGYLKDLTGARRFWPVACHGVIDSAGIERDRDQLWAEAVHRYRAGQKWWLETPERHTDCARLLRVDLRKPDAQRTRSPLLPAMLAWAKFKDTRRRPIKSGSQCQRWKRPNSEHLLSNFQYRLTIRPKKIAKTKCELKDGGGRSRCRTRLSNRIPC